MDKYSLPNTLIRMKVEHFKSQPSDRELKNFYADYCSQACSDLEDKKNELEAIAKALSAGSGRTPKNGLNGKQALDALRRLDGNSLSTAWGIIAEDLVKILRKQGGKTRLKATDKASKSAPIDQKFYGRWVQLKIDQHGYDLKTACEEIAAVEVDAQNNLLYKTPRDRELRALNILKSYTAYCKKLKDGNIQA